MAVNRFSSVREEMEKEISSRSDKQSNTTETLDSYMNQRAQSFQEKRKNGAARKSYTAQMDSRRSANDFLTRYNRFLDDVEKSGYTPENVKAFDSIQAEYNGVSGLFNQGARKQFQDSFASIKDYFGSFAGKADSMLSSEQIANRREELQKSYQEALDEAIQANPGVSLHNIPVTDEMKSIKEQMNELDSMEDAATYNKYQDMISSLSDKERKALSDSHGRDTTMAYGYLLQNGYSREDINAMYETLMRDQNAKTSGEVLDAVYDYAGQNVGTGAVGFTGARAGNIVGGITGTLQAIHDTAQHYFQGSPYRTTDPNGLGYLPSRAASAADQSISDAIEGDDGGIIRKGAAFVYRGAANAADNLARMALASATGGGALAGAGINSALSFTQGFQGSYREAQEKGGNPIQGLLVGSVDGGMEVFTESRTFERWMNLKDPELIGQGVFEWLKSAAVGIGNEITEEEASYIANTIADAVVMADKSESTQFIKDAVADGKTPAEAKWELVKKYAHEMAVTAADTAMSTLLMDGVTGAVANHQYKRTYGGSAAELVQEGLESPDGTQSRTLAEQYKQKLDSGKPLSGGELRRLVNANEEQFAKEEAEAGAEPGVDAGMEENVADSEMETDKPEPEKTITLESLSEKYGPYAEAMRRNYLEGQDAEEYDRAFQTAYDMGKSGLNKDALNRVEALRGLSESQREIAYEIGQTASAAAAKAQSAKNSEAVNWKTGWHKGVVRGEGVKIADLTKTFNDPQRKAYSALSTIAEATGIDIVLYQSQANEDGVFQEEQGRFKWSDNTIYIDVNAGLSGTKDVGSLAKYTMLRTYGHEFTHFIEKWNPEQYNDFRKAVFETMENPEDLIETRLAQDSTGKMSYDDASREVVAEAMTDILEDSKFLQKLADKHTSVFETLRNKLKEFVSNLKSYFQSLAKNGSREARLLKQEVGDSISYLEDIVKRFDDAAVQAVENYQKTVAEDNSETAVDNSETSSETKISENETKDDSIQDSEAPIESNQAESDSIQEEEEKEEPKQEEKQEPETTSYGSFSITPNPERGTLEIRFDSKPGENVRDVLKENKFRWSSKNKLWYGKADQKEISKRISDAMASTENQSDSQEPVAENNHLLDHPAVNNTEEVTQNAEADVYGQEESDGALREDHQGGIPESEQSGEGAARLLDEPQEEAIQQHDQGAAADDSSGGGPEAGRSGGRPDSERDGRSGGTGSGAVSDLRRDADVNQDDGGIAETVQREIEQKSTEKPKGENYVIGESLNLAKGEKARYRDNVAALRLIHQLNREGRFSTREEQEVLSRYVGWGGLDGAFGELGYNRETRKSEMRAKSGWEKEFKELRQLVTDGIITEEEYRGMSESTKNAHYTSMEVISAMYDGLKKLGFQGGRMLEPSSGVGNFVGGMPADMTANVKSWTMVELDRVTGQIAKYLYPNNDVRIEGFQDSNIPNDYMDVAIGNVPFGNYGVVDRSYPKRVTKSIHNYFFAKSIDKVRPGGIVMFITSGFTMNSQDNAIRQYIMDRADLLGAIRLPNTAFKGNAGTEVVTDILILKKRVPGTAYSGETFLEAPQKSIPGSWRNVNVNEYFSSHPEMVLGKETVTRGMYGADTLTYAPLENAGSLGDQIRAAFDKITGKMDYVQKTAESARKAAEKAVRKPKEGAYRRAQDGTITNGSGVAVTNADTAKRIGGMIDIRDAYRNLVERIQQGRTKEEIAKARKYLNQVYDSFVKENGLINDPKNKKAFEEDPYRFSLFALETDYQKGGKGKPSTAKKADIFTKDTIKANVTVTHAESVSDGLIVSINTTGGVDASLIARLTGRSKEEVTRELIDSRMAFKTRSGSLEAPETYLSGNVRAKLREAEALARNDKDFQNNVEELRRVIPKDVPYDEIHVSPGAVWVPTDVYADFIAHMLGGRNNGYGGPDVEVGYSAQTGEYKIRLNNARLKGNYHNTQEWGTSRRSFLELFESLLGNGNVTVTDREIDANGKERRVVNKDETAAAQEKADKIKEEFRNWIWSDETRRTELSKLYNETYNALANPKYDGSSLTVNGLNASFSLREHQANAVKRIIASGGNTLLAHRVGAGKTLEMAAAAMKLRELGIVKKPVFAVPKSLVAQWGVEFNSYFPAAKLLVADDKSFSKENRKVFTNNIANGDFDAVILSYEQFGKIPMSKEYQQRFLQEQIDEVLTAIAEEKAENGGKSLTVKQMEKKVAQLKTKLERLKIQSVDEDNVDFETLGIDALFVDEAHNFKNLQYTTKMQNVGGLGNSDGSQRAFDLYTKIRYLQQLNGGRGIVFATATPVMNSMAEMYIMQKYLQSDMLKQLGITTFDAWAKQFGEVVNTYEIKPSGQGVRAKQVFSNFKNLNELQLMFRSFSDVLTEVPGLKIPKMRGGGVQIVECEPGKFQKDYMKSLEKRANNVKNVDPSEDNMLKITSDGRKVSYTQRMIDPTLPYEPGCKLYRCCENILKEYRAGKNIKTVDGKTGKKVTINGTQIVFCDMATPKGKDKSKANDEISTEIDDSFDSESARLYEDMRDYLAKKGIPREEIAFIHEADTDLKRKQLFADMNAGKVRVLIGSTGKMGVGMNAQRCVTAIHHMDAPWRPGDVEQRDGRAFRQGNLNDEVAKYVYVTTGSFDARLWDILDRKSGFINQIMNGDDVGRNAEDTGDVTLSAAEVKALASGNPMIKESVELADELQKLNGLKRTHDSAVIRARTNLQNDIKAIASLEMSIEARKEDLKKRKDTYSEEKFSMQIGGKTFADRKDAGEALLSAILSKAKTENEFVEIGSFSGFQILAAKSGGEYDGVLQGSTRYGFKVHINNPTLMAGQMAKKISGLETELKAQEELLAQTITDKDAQEKLIEQPFERQAELDEKRRRYDYVMSELNKTDQQFGAEDVEQHQRRTNTLTDREILSMAADRILSNEALSMDAAVSDSLDIFKKRLAALDSLQEQRRELGRTYKEQQFGANVDREKAAETLKQMRDLDGKIQEAENKVIAAETAPALRKVLPVARRIVEQNQKEQDDAVLQRWRDRRNNAAAIKKYRDRISKDVTDLGNWIISPSNKTDMKHVPDVLKNTVIEFINSIDFTSKRQLNGGEATQADIAFMNRLVALQRALDKNAEETGLYSGYNDLPPGFQEKLKGFIASAQAIVNAKSGQSVINQMTSQELKSLSEIVKAVKKLVQDFNRFHANAVYQHVYDAGDATIRELNEYNDAKSRTKAGEGINNFVFWNQIRPAYAFERFGNGGKAIYDGLRRGQAQLAFDTKAIVSFSEKAYTEKEVTEWDKEVKTIQLEDGTVKMRVSQIMSFYELLKREQAKGHIFGQGIRVSTFLSNGKKVSDTGHTISIEDANRIIAELTPRQIAVADALQKYMQEKGGSWGNYVSVKRFGEKMFGEENYFPINSDGRHIEAVADDKMEGQSLYALLNMGFTKKLQEEANNRIVVYSIFDVFSNHMASMAQYHSFALPVLDALKWFNYQQKEPVTVMKNGKEHVQNQVVDSVRDQLDRVFGVPEETKPGAGRRGYAENFIIGIIKAFNGTESHGITSDEIGLNSLRRFNMAQVAYNFRVVIQQPMAITRAAMIIDYGSIIRGLKLSPKAIQKNIEEMNQYSGIAAWKDLGFYDTNISRGLTDIIKHKKTGMEKFREAGMWGAEKADQLTWAAMWSACKEEVQRKHGIMPGSEHFYDAVSSLFEEVIYKTQVVDSVLTKNEYLRSKGLFARATGSFMSEPTTTASMLVDAFDKYRMDLQKKGGNHRDAWRNNGKRIGRTLYVYGLGAVILAAVQAIADAFRDDDEYEEYGEKWMEAFIGNVIDELNPFNKLPLVTEFCDLAKNLLAAVGVDTYGYAPSSIWLQWADDLVKGTQILYQKIFGDGNNYTWYGGISKMLKAVSGMSGVPMAAVTREAITGWNSIIQYMAPDLVVKTYDPGDKNTIKYAYLDGYLTEEEAYQELLDKGIAKDENDVYWTVQEWGGGDGYSKYDAINQAVRNGESITKQMAELTSHGHAEKDVISNIKSSIGKWYQEGEITGHQAVTMLTRYTGLTADEANASVNKWKCKVETGIAFDDIKDSFMGGETSYSRAVDMYVKYGGLSRQEATEKVYTWDFIKKHPGCEDISYSAIESYETYCERTGMNAKVFYDAWKFNYSAKADVDSSGKAISGSKKLKVLRYINGLGLSYAQKDSLYYAFGWSQSTISEAPWH
jgi:N12 class adenine-specific DNA methylase